MLLDVTRSRVYLIQNDLLDLKYCLKEYNCFSCNIGYVVNYTSMCFHLYHHVMVTQ